MLAIRNNAASEARARAAHTMRTGSVPDNDTKIPAEFKGLSASGCFMRALVTFGRRERHNKKGSGGPKPFYFLKNVTAY
jgi:hypothetical protein